MPIFTEEILSCFSEMKNKRTKQENDIPMFLWRTIGHIIVKPIWFLVNQMFSQAKFSHMLKMADISPIFKRGDPKIPKNYRLIAVFERVILNSITDYCTKNNLLPPSQYGLRSNHSKKDAILKLLLEIENNSLSHLKTCVIFLDMSKAFDLVNHQILLEILNSLGFRGHFSTLLKNYLSGSKFRIKSNYYCF